MPASYSFAPANRPPANTLVATPLVSDNASGDTTTFVSASQTAAAPGTVCTDYTTSAALTVLCDLGAITTLTNVSAVVRMGWQFTCAPANQGAGNVCARCALPTDNGVSYGPLARYALEYLDTDPDAVGVWQPLGFGNLGTGGAWQALRFDNRSFLTQYLRLVLTGQVVDHDANGNSNTVALAVSDFRANETPACTPPAVPSLGALRQITHHQPMIILVEN